MQLFYSPEIKQGINILSQEESQHCVRVLRKKNGDRFHITDGRGNMYTAEVIEADHKHCVVNAGQPVGGWEKRAYNLHMAVAPTKNMDRFEWFLEKATEIGVDRITPIESEHSERRVTKTDRCLKVVAEAMKQSVKAYLPRVDEIETFEKFINAAQGTQKYIAHCNDSADKQPLSRLCSKGGEVVILIGPEGDFSPSEVEAAKRAGFSEISLGLSRLRTETAAVAAVHTVNLINEL